MPNEPFVSEDRVDPELTALLADEAIWEPLDTVMEDSIVAAIAIEAQPSPVVTSITAARSRRPMFLASAAAALVLVVVGLFAIGGESDDPTGIELALVATELAPDASGAVTIAETPLGTRLILDVGGLPPAANGQYYEAWLRTGPEVGVSAGTFHLRGGDGQIELWAGVTVADYPLFTITIQDEGDPLSSGQVVLKGRVAE